MRALSRMVWSTAARCGYLSRPLAPVKPTSMGCGTLAAAFACRAKTAGSKANGSQWCATPERRENSRLLPGWIQVKAPTAPVALAHKSLASRLPTISRQPLGVYILFCCRGHGEHRQREACGVLREACCARRGA